MKKLLFAITLFFITSPAYAAVTSLQWGVDRTTSPWMTCVYDQNNICQGVFTVPATGGGALVPSSHGGTGVNNGASTLTIGGNVAFSGAFAFNGTLTAPTSVTFPTSGTLATVAASLQVANNLSDLASASTARTNLGVTGTGADTTYAFRANNLSDLASASTARTNLGVTGTGADTTYAFRANNLSDLASASTARTNLGLGALATVTPGTGVATALAINVGSAGAFQTAFGITAYNGANPGNAAAYGQIANPANGYTTISNAMQVSQGSPILATGQFGQNAVGLQQAFVATENIASGDTAGNAGFALSGYGLTHSATTGVVGVFGFGGTTIAGSSQWASNYLIGNCAFQGCTVGLNNTVSYGSEYNFSIMAPATNAPTRGLYAIGNSTITQANANASTIFAFIDIDSPGITQTPHLQWLTAIKTENGSASTGLSIGAQGTIANSGSQSVVFNTVNSIGGGAQAILQADPGGDMLITPTANGAVALQDGNGGTTFETAVAFGGADAAFTKLAVAGALCNASNGAVSTNASGPCSGQTIATGQLATASSGASPGSGQLGETVTNTGGSAISIGNGTVVTLATVTLSAGDWNCYGLSETTYGTSSVYTTDNQGITATPVSFPAFPAGISESFAAITTSAATPFVEAYSTNAVIVRPTTSTAYSLVRQIAHSAGTITAQGYLQCVRQD